MGTRPQCAVARLRAQARRYARVHAAPRSLRLPGQARTDGERQVGCALGSHLAGIEMQFPRALVADAAVVARPEHSLSRFVDLPVPTIGRPRRTLREDRHVAAQGGLSSCLTAVMQRPGLCLSLGVSRYVHPAAGRAAPAAQRSEETRRPGPGHRSRRPPGPPSLSSSSRSSGARSRIVASGW